MEDQFSRTGPILPVILVRRTKFSAVILVRQDQFYKIPLTAQILAFVAPTMKMRSAKLTLELGWTRYISFDACEEFDDGSLPSFRDPLELCQPSSLSHMELDNAKIITAKIKNAGNWIFAPVKIPLGHKIPRDTDYLHMCLGLGKGKGTHHSGQWR